MTGADGGPDIRAERVAGLDTSVAHPARVYDYWLGGKDNFAADREAAERVLAVTPGLRWRVRAVEPGLVQVHQWRPDPDDFAPEGVVSAHGAVGRKPGA